MKKICPICSKNKGKRYCKIKNDTLICSLCCARVRNNECEGCSYYEDSKRFIIEKEKQREKKQQFPHFIKRIDPQVDDEVNKALELAEKGRLSEGKKILIELLAQNPDIDSVHFGLGTVAAFQKKYDEALSHFDKAIKIFPYYTEAWFNKGVIYKETLEIEKMIEAFKKVEEIGDINEDFVLEAKEILASFTKNLHNTKGITLDEFMSAAKKFKEGYNYMDKREWKNAINKFQETISIDHHHTQSYGNIGICYARLGNKQKALEALDKAIELDPHYKPALHNKKIITSLSEGEKLGDLPMFSVEYYKDLLNKKKGLNG